jgi:cobalamin biosynthesis Mg chelatase CobN
MSAVSKAIAGAAAGGLLSIGTLVSVPADVQMPWYGYVLVGVVNAVIAFGTVYFAPRNSQ